LAAEEGLSCIATTYWDLPSVFGQIKKVSQSDKGFIGHAGEIETSLQLFLQPERVDQGAATWSPGVWGDPSTGAREKGESIVKVVVDALVKFLREYHSGILEDRLVWRKEVL
jgi:creatinine amidohydrolase/Fe(II)-dependent formamide hydrolase-like protein